MKTKRNPHAGSDFDDWLEDEGIQSVVHTGAATKALSHLIGSHLKAQNISVSALAKKMGTSRSQVDRLLNPREDKSVTLETASRAAAALGKRLILELVDNPKRSRK